MQGNYAVFIRDKEGTLIQRLNEFVSMRILLTLNEVGSWQISSKTLERCPFTYGDGIIVLRDGIVIYSGVVTQIQEMLDAVNSIYEWEVQGTGDLEYLARRICYVDPETGDPNKYDHYTSSGKLSSEIEKLISLNVGGDALEERKESIIEANDAEEFGPNVSISLRFQNLLKAIVSYCTANGYNIRPVWDAEASKVYYELFAGRDLTEAIIFTEQLNNITESKYIASVPQGNYILAGGTGQMTERSFANAINTDSVSTWGRIEVFQDARNNSGDIEAYAEQVLSKNSDDTIGYSCTASSDENAPQYGRDFILGDYVSMKVMETYITAQVQQCEITLSEGIETISPICGTVAVGKFREIFNQLSSLRQDVNELLGTEIE